MELLRKTYQQTGNLHHAYLIEGERDSVIPELFDFLKNDVGITTEGNPDFLHLTFEVFGIDEGRKLKEMHTGKAFSGGKRFFVIDVVSFTTEAENSLLKVFEDPVPDVHFFITIPSAENILPTLRSRFFIVEHESKYTKGDHAAAISAEEFLTKNRPERLSMINGIIEEKEKEQAIKFLNDLEAVFHSALIQTSNKERVMGKKDIAYSIEEIEQGKKYINNRSSSIKLILEHLALVLPGQQR